MEAECSSSQCSGAGRTTPHEFRIVEKQYKAYKAKRGKGYQQTDFSNVVDFRDIEANTQQNRDILRAVGCQCRGKEIFGLDGHEGSLPQGKPLSFI